mmetsp:Transcript_37585/g.61354  ORF Transcript_37585/g.61354 Transcript_37585/m.61354 type:complete len:95 (+) Transcript_37585:228-512(+)
MSGQIEPKILLLGLTASPKPRNSLLTYRERSMWKILRCIHGIPQELIKDAESAMKVQTEIINNCWWAKCFKAAFAFGTYLQMFTSEDKQNTKES